MKTIVDFKMAEFGLLICRNIHLTDNCDGLRHDCINNSNNDNNNNGWVFFFCKLYFKSYFCIHRCLLHPPLLMLTSCYPFYEIALSFCDARCPHDLSPASWL